MKAVYDRAFYETRDAETAHFANRLAEIIVELFSPDSAVDLGCGVGTVLHHLKAKGCTEILGIEGPWLDASQLVIEKKEFRFADLTRPLDVGRKFDVGISLEVAEHINEEYADTFVDSLCSLAPQIVFSAAIPRQGGVDHINERWQSYWATKFAERKYAAFDAIRPLIWNNKSIPTHYRQNTIVYVDANKIAEHAILSPFEVRDLGLFDRVHPDLYLAHVKNPMSISYKQLLAYFPAATFAACGRATKRIFRRRSGA